MLLPPEFRGERKIWKKFFVIMEGYKPGPSPTWIY